MIREGDDTVQTIIWVVFLRGKDYNMKKKVVSTN